MTKTKQIYCVIRPLNTTKQTSFTTTYQRMLNAINAQGLGAKEEDAVTFGVAHSVDEQDLLYACVDPDENINLDAVRQDYRNNLYACITTSTFQLCIAPTRRLADDGFNRQFHNKRGKI